VGDHLGGTALVTDAGGAMLNRVRYFPFGSVRTQELAGGAGSLLTDKLFTGQQRESANGVYDYQARLYDARMGRFLQPDPLVPEPGNPQSLNPYAYVLNNPLRYTDPTGMRWVDADGEPLDIPPEPPEPPGPPGPIRCPCIIQAPPHWDPTPPVIGGRTLEFSRVIPVVRAAPGAGHWIAGFTAAWQLGQILGHAIGLDTLRSDGGIDAAIEAAKEEAAEQVLDSPELLEGATYEEVRDLLPDSWNPEQARSPHEEGVRAFAPGSGGSDGIRVMRGNPGNPDPLHQGPRVIVTKHGQKTTIPLKGNPTAP
jgi:RHS repeat-associated protein